MISPTFPCRTPRKLARHRGRAGLLALTMAAAALPAAASEFTVLHSFAVGGPYDPQSTLAIDAEGNLYGSTIFGGDHGAGTLFKIGAQGYSTLHSFDFEDGSSPSGRLTLDADGNLWGTTSAGGQLGGAIGGGTAFRLAPDGQLTYASLDQLGVAGLTAGPDGAYYGVTYGNDKRDHGSVYRLDPATFAVTTLHQFDGADGSSPLGGLLSTGGMLAGTASAGGRQGRGTAFMLKPDGSGFRVQHTFEGGWIHCGLTLDAQGRAWGVASLDKPPPAGANKGLGAIYRIDATGTVTLGHRFAKDESEGWDVESELLLARDGWLYGMALLGGSHHGGTLFRFNPADDAFEVLHHFSGHADDGEAPYGGLIQDAAGAFYGTTAVGGANGAGVVFQFVP